MLFLDMYILTYLVSNDRKKLLHNFSLNGHTAEKTGIHIYSRQEQVLQQETEKNGIMNLVTFRIYFVYPNQYLHTGQGQ